MTERARVDTSIILDSREETTKAEVALPWLTVETALYILLGLLALLTRFYALGNRPLTTSEAAQALHAWQAASGPGGDALAASPLLFAGQALVFALFGPSDVAVRLLPALAGTVLVLLPYLWRRRLGRIGALVASALLLFSPTVLITSRDGSGDILLLTAGLAALTGFLGWVDLCRPRFIYLAAASAAMALAAGSGVYTLILALTVGFGLVVFFDRRVKDGGDWASVRTAWQEARRQREWIRNGVALFVGTLVLVPTTLLLHLEGVQAVADLFPAWINHFAPWAGEQLPSFPLAVLVLCEPLLLLFGLAGAIMAFRQRDLAGQLLAVWAGVALVMALLAGGRGPGDVLFVVGPLGLLAGSAVGRLLEEILRSGKWPQDGLIVGLLAAVAVFFYMEMGIYAYRRETNYLWLAILALGLGVGVFALYAVWYGRKPAWCGGALTLLVLLSLITVSSAINLTQRRGHDPRELLVVEGTSPNVRDLPAVLERASMRRLGALEIIPITVDRSVGPVVRWYLRGFRGQTWLATMPGAGVTTEAVITPWKPDAPDLGAAYFGEDFLVRTTWRPHNFTWADWANWLVFRKSPDRPQADRIVLWLKHQED